MMPAPDNTLPMMTGTGPYGPIEMGGMFSMLKVRKDQKPGDYSDPGWFKQPAGTQSFEWTGDLPEPARFQSEAAAAGGTVPGLHNPPAVASAPTRPGTTLTVRKPGAGSHRGH